MALLEENSFALGLTAEELCENVQHKGGQGLWSLHSGCRRNSLEGSCSSDTFVPRPSFPVSRVISHVKTGGQPAARAVESWGAEEEVRGLAPRRGWSPRSRHV